MKIDSHYGIVPDSKTRVRCVFCGVHIPKAYKCIEQHLNGAKHKENIDLMSENGIVLKDVNLYCNPCKRILLEDESVMKHTESDDHTNWLATVDNLTGGEFISLDKYLSSEEDEFYCEACKCTIGCNLHSVEEHVNQYNHRANVVDKLKPLNGIFPVENDDEVWCKLCDVYIDNTVQDILDHIDDDEQHVAWFVETEGLIENQNISLTKYLASEHEMNIYCNRCNVEIVCNVQSIEDHIYNESHIYQS